MASPQPKAVPKPRTRRVHTPTVLQMEAVECGAASLAIVLGYYGRIVPLEELRVATGVSRDGSKASNVVKAAAQYGLEAHGYSKETDELRELELPFVIFWNFNHFLVVEGFGKGVIYLNDPGAVHARSPTRNLTNLLPGWCSVSRRCQALRKAAKSPVCWQRSRAVEGFGDGVGLCRGGGFGFGSAGASIADFLKVFVDDFLVEGRKEWMVPLLAGMGMTLLLRAGLLALQSKYLMRMQAKLAITTASKFFWHVLHLPIEFFTQRYGGEIGSRLPINDWVAHLLSGQLATTVLDLVMVVFLGVAYAIRCGTDVGRNRGGSDERHRAAVFHSPAGGCQRAFATGRGPVDGHLDERSGLRKCDHRYQQATSADPGQWIQKNTRHGPSFFNARGQRQSAFAFDLHHRICERSRSGEF